MVTSMRGNVGGARQPTPTERPRKLIKHLSSTASVASKYCLKHGHHISIFTENGDHGYPDPRTNIIRCTQCGLLLEEIRRGDYIIEIPA